VYSLRKAAVRLTARCGAALVLASVVLLTGCHNFFVCEKASCPSSGGGGSTTTDYAYISNATAGSTDISAYDIGNGSLAAISGSPFNIGFQPAAMSVSPNDAFLYVATFPGATNPGIYVFNINSSGGLSSGNGGDVLITAAISSMTISSDGNYLFIINQLGTILSEYQTNTSTGALALVSSFQLPGASCTVAGSPVTQTCTVAVAPSGEFVAASLGTAGTAVFPYASGSGITSSSYTLIPSGTTSGSPTGDFSVVLDNNNYAYIARTSTLAVYSISSSGAATLQSTATFSGSAAPRDVVLSSSQGYVYTANPGGGDISGFSIGSSGALTSLSGSPFTGPTSVSAVGVDKSGDYMVAAGYNGTSGVQLFTIGTGGALTLTTSAGTGTSTAYPAILALSH
jgi:6-phosphogluconolactonase